MINMFPALDVLQLKVVPVMCSLNQLDINDSHMDGQERDKSDIRAHKAEISRQLLELADTLALLEALVRNEYWFMKGKGISIEIDLLEEL